MNLFFIVLFVISISILLKFVPKLSKIIITLSILFIISFYFVLTYNCQKNYFFPHKYNNNDQYYYNRLVNSIKNNKLCLYDMNDFSNESV